MKKPLLFRTIFLSILFILSFIVSQAQWSRIRSIYGGALANDGAAGFSINGKGYVMAGSSSDKLYQYDTATNTWTQKGSVPVGVGHAFCMSFVLNNKAYIIGGDTGGHPVATVWMYDPAATGNPWTQKADFPGGQRDAGYGFVVNNTGYAGGGFDGASIYGDIWKYNDATDKWTVLPINLPSLIFPSSFVVGGNAYVLTGGQGQSGTNETQGVWRFDPSSLKWLPVSSFGGSARQACFAFSNNGYGYVGGGMSGYSTVYNDMWRYDAAHDKWSQVEDAPLIGPVWSSAFVIGNSAYVGIGAAFTASGLTGIDSFYKYRLSTPTAVAGIPGKEGSWTAYPNPARDVLQLAGDIPNGATASIYDCTGRAVKIQENLQGRTIDVRDLAPGIYNIRLSSDAGVSVRQFSRSGE